MIPTILGPSATSPALLKREGLAAPSYFHRRRVHAREGIKYCVVSVYIDDRIFRKRTSRFRKEIVLPVLCSLPGVRSSALQTVHIRRADAEVAALLGVPVGEIMAVFRRVLAAPGGTVISLPEVNYRGTTFTWERINSRGRLLGSSLLLCRIYS